MKPVISWVLARLEEPSTYAGIASLVATMSFLPHAQDIAGQITVIGGVAASALAVILSEKKGWSK